jgi:hypothetical protein
MSEDRPRSFPRQNSCELVQVYTKTTLEKAGFTLQRISKEGIVFTVSTDKRVPDNIISNIRQYASIKGFTVNFD